jgi:hypothetical protein
MPDGLLVTIPPPVPILLTVRVCMLRVNVATTVLAASIVTVQESVPLHAPLQPAKVEIESGVAKSVTSVPWS